MQPWSGYEAKRGVASLPASLFVWITRDTHSQLELLLLLSLFHRLLFGSSSCYFSHSLSLAKALCLLCCMQHFRFRFPLADYLVCTQASCRTPLLLLPSSSFTLVIVVLCFPLVLLLLLLWFGLRYSRISSRTPSRLPTFSPSPFHRRLFDKTMTWHAT